MYCTCGASWALFGRNWPNRARTRFALVFCTDFPQDADVEAVNNSVLIPLDQLEDALRSFAVPGKYGSVRIQVLVRPTAAQEIDWDVERRTITDAKVSKETVAVVPSNDRAYRVRDEVRAHAEDFKLVCPVAEVTCEFRDGFLQQWKMVKRETRSA